MVEFGQRRGARIMISQDLIERVVITGGFKDIQDLIAKSFRRKFGVRIRKPFLASYYELYRSRKTIPDWVWEVCRQTLRIPEEFELSEGECAAGVRFLADNQISKCRTCGIPLVYAAHFATDNRKSCFCSTKCLCATIIQKSKVI